MRIKQAAVLRFKQLCAQKNITYNELATRAGVTPSTVYSMMNEKRLDISLITIKKLCDGLEITVPEFFNHPLFSELQQELS